MGPEAGKLVNCAAGKSCLKSDPRYGCTGEFQGQCTWDSSATALAECGKYDECHAIYCSSAFDNGKLLCFGRSSATVGKSAHSTDQSWYKAYTSTQALRGEGYLGKLVNLTLDHDGTTATITMAGPAGAWFGVGFNAQVSTCLVCCTNCPVCATTSLPY